MLGNIFGELGKGKSKPPLSAEHKQAISKSQTCKVNSKDTLSSNKRCNSLKI